MGLILCPILWTCCIHRHTSWCPEIEIKFFVTQQYSLPSNQMTRFSTEILPMYNYTSSRNSLRQTTRDPRNEFLLSDVLIRICFLCAHYYSKPNNAQKLVCVKQKIVLKMFVLTRFYCKMYGDTHLISYSGKNLGDKLSQIRSNCEQREI